MRLILAVVAAMIGYAWFVSTIPTVDCNDTADAFEHAVYCYEMGE